MKKDQNQLTWLMVSLIAFNMVWGLGNVVNNYSQQGISVIVSWILILALYFIPYALIVGQLGSTFKESGGGVSDWVEKTSTKRLAYFAAWTYWVVHIPYLAQKPQGVLIPLGWALQGNGNFLSNLDIHWIVILSLLIFGAFLYLSTKGLSTLKVIGGLAGSAMLIMSILFVLLAVGAPFIKPDLQRLIWISLVPIFLILTFHILLQFPSWSLRLVELRKFPLMLTKPAIPQRNFQRG